MSPTTIANVSNEHVWKSVVGGRVALSKLIAFGRSGRKADWSAVHVHLTVSDLVEPGPSEGCISSGEGGWDGVGIGVGVDLTRIIAVVSSDVFHGAATLDGMNDFPDTACGGLEVISDGDLARTTAVDSTTNESELLGGTKGHDIVSTLSSVNTGSLLAREIGSGGEERRVVEGGCAIWGGRAHFHMGRGQGGEAKDGYRRG